MARERITEAFVRHFRHVVDRTGNSPSGVMQALERHPDLAISLEQTKNNPSALRQWLHETVGLNFSDIETRWKEFPVIVAPQYVSDKYGPDQPHGLYGYLTQIRLAYTIGADSAAIALCRATTELLIRDHYPSDLNIKNDLSGLIRSVQNLPRFAFLKKYHLTDKVQEAHDILHGRSLGGSTVDTVRHQHRARGLVRDWVVVLDEMITKAPASGLPTRARPKLAQGTPALTSQRSDAAIGSRTQRESSDSATNCVDELRPLRPMEVAQTSSPSLGQRFAALLSLIAGFAAVLAMAGVSLYLLAYLLAPSADEKLAATTAPALNASATSPKNTPAAIATVSATSPERAPEFSTTNSTPAPAVSPEEAPPIVAVTPSALAPGAAPAVGIPAPAVSPEEAPPIVAVAPSALAPGTPAAVGIPAPAVSPEEAPPIVAVTPSALAPGTPAAVGIPAPAVSPEEAPPIVAVTPGALAPGAAPAVVIPAPAAPPEELRASTAEISALLARGDWLFGIGDVASARLFYERATDAGDAQAALRLGETYDPFFLMRARLNGVRGDLAVATRWYRRARDLGASEAEILLKSVENR